MSQGVRSLIFAAFLSVPLLYTLAAAPPMLAIQADGQVNGLLGPNFPALIDTSGNGLPDGNDLGAVFVRDGNVLALNTQWDCNPENSNNQLRLFKSDPHGKFDGLSRRNFGDDQVIQFTEFANGAPVGGQLTLAAACLGTCDGQLIRGGGTARLLDRNGDGAFDGWEASGRNGDGEPVSISMSFVYVDGPAGGASKYISIPWAAASLIGVNAEPACGGPLPQVFLPIADFGGIGFDFDGDGHPDPEFYTSSRLTPGCTSGLGYWKNHAGLGPQADVVSARLPVLLGSPGGPKTVHVSTAAQAVSILSFGGTPGNASNGIIKLYAHLLAVKLNAANAAVPPALANLVNSVDVFLATHDAADWAGLSQSDKRLVLAWLATLEAYNEGAGGVPACS